MSCAANSQLCSQKNKAETRTTRSSCREGDFMSASPNLNRRGHKVVIIGDDCYTSGKSSSTSGKGAIAISIKSQLLLSFISGGNPKESSYPKTGFLETTSVTRNVKNREIQLDLWDSSGVEDISKFLTNSEVIVLVYSIYQAQSFENIQSKWKPLLKRYAKKAPIILVAINNNTNNNTKRAVSPQDGEKMASTIKAQCFIDCCPSRMENVNLIFDRASELVTNTSSKDSNNNNESAGGKLMSNGKKILSLFKSSKEKVLSPSSNNESNSRGSSDENYPTNNSSGSWKTNSSSSTNMLASTPTSDSNLTTAEDNSSNYYEDNDDDSSYYHNSLLDSLKSNQAKSKGLAGRNTTNNPSTSSSSPGFFSSAPAESKTSKESLAEKRIRNSNSFEGLSSQQQQLVKWLDDNKLSEYTPIFLKNGFDMSSLLLLEEKHIKELGIELGPALKIRNALHKLKIHPQYMKDLYLEDIILSDTTLGKGYFSTVLKAQWKATPVAVKVLRHQSQSNMDELIKEVMLLKKLNHPNVLRFLGLYEDPQTLDIHIVTEYMENGSLKDLLMKELELSLASRIGMAKNIAAGMDYLSSQKVVHRDLSAKNCLVDSSLRVKVADFGLSRKFDENAEYYTSDSNTMPYRWCAPECLLKRKFSIQSDVWSYGIVLWEILTNGATPYAEMEPSEIIKRVAREGYRLERPSECPQELYQLMLDCWKNKSKERPSFYELHAKLEMIQEDVNQKTINKTLKKQSSRGEYIDDKFENTNQNTPNTHNNGNDNNRISVDDHDYDSNQGPNYSPKGEQKTSNESGGDLEATNAADYHRDEDDLLL